MTQRTYTTTMKFSAVLVAMVLLVLTYGFRPERTPVALIMKVVPNVMKKSATTDWVTAKRSEALTSGDQVKTGKRALAVIKFMDNSIVRVREQSDVTIIGENTGGKYVKTVQITNGAFGFEVKKQKDEMFRLTSPTSVASIRGTKGKLTRGKGNDTLIVPEGLVNMRNIVSDKDVDVPAGFIAFSNQDGSISSRPATDQELADATDAATGGSTNDLNLEMRDSKGNKKDLKIKFKRQ